MAELTESMYERLMTRLAELDQHADSRFAATLAARSETQPARTRLVLPLLPDEVVAETQVGTFIVVPPYNLDVAIGILRSGMIEPWVTQVALRLAKPGCTYVNAGANFGYYMALAGTRVGAQGKVIGVEANPEVFRYLVKSMYWSGCVGNTQLFNLAVSDAEGELQFQFDPQFMGGGNLYNNDASPSDTVESCLWNSGGRRVPVDHEGRFVTGGYMCQRKVRARPLDLIVGDQPVDVLQMDIEGAEGVALLGARDMIRKNANLNILMEWYGARLAMPRFAETYRTVLDLLAREGFQAWRVETDRFGRLGDLPRLKPFAFSDLGSAGMCDLLFARKLEIDCELVSA